MEGSDGLRLSVCTVSRAQIETSRVSISQQYTPSNSKVRQSGDQMVELPRIGTGSFTGALGSYAESKHGWRVIRGRPNCSRQAWYSTWTRRDFYWCGRRLFGAYTGIRAEHPDPLPPACCRSRGRLMARPHCRCCDWFHGEHTLRLSPHRRFRLLDSREPRMGTRHTAMG